MIALLVQNHMVQLMLEVISNCHCLTAWTSNMAKTLEKVSSRKG
jgi:hypothetical protein